MPTKLTRVEEILGAEVPALAGLRDDAVSTTCPSCGTRQNLGRATIHQEGADTQYVCANNCQPIVVVSDPEVPELPGRGHRYGAYTIRNVSDLDVAGPQPMKIPASPAALEALSGRTRKYRI